MAEVLEHVAGHGAEVMVATHNQASIEATVALMGQLGIEPNENGVCMGQLLGMADHLTFTLGRNGYRVRPLWHVLCKHHPCLKRSYCSICMLQPLCRDGGRRS